MACQFNNIGPANTITMTAGTSKTFGLTVNDCDGNPVDITGARIIFTVKGCVDDTQPIIQKDSNNPLEIVLTQPRLGQAQIYLQPADTQNLDPGEYVFDVWVILPSGKRYQVITPTPFIIKAGVTYLP